MPSKNHGIDSVTKSLNKLADNAKAIDGNNEIPMNELFTSNFMKTHTSFEDFESFVKASELGSTPFLRTV
jgi:hypothetical protein